MNVLNIMGFLTFKNVMLLLSWKIGWGKFIYWIFLEARLLYKGIRSMHIKIGSKELMWQKTYNLVWLQYRSSWQISFLLQMRKIVWANSKACWHITCSPSNALHQEAYNYCAIMELVNGLPEICWTSRLLRNFRALPLHLLHLVKFWFIYEGAIKIAKY